MANEGVVNLALSFVKRGLSFQSTPDDEALRTHRFDVNSQYATQRIFTIGTTDTVLDLANVPAPSYCFFHNLSLSNPILIGGDGSSYPITVRPGGYGLLEFSTADIHAIAGTNCNLEALILPSADVPPPPNVGNIIQVFLSNDLAFQVDYLTDEPNYEFYPTNVQPNADAGTFIWDGLILYAPTPDAGTATDNIYPATYYTPVSQNTTGAGTSGDPYVTVTVVAAGTLIITQTDTWFPNSQYFTTDIAITGTGSGILYRAGNSRVANDNSYGFTEVLSGRNAVGVSTHANNTPAGRTIEFIPLTDGNNYMEDEFDNVWSVLGARTSFPDTIQGSTQLDAGLGISWPFTAPATFSLRTKFT